MSAEAELQVSVFNAITNTSVTSLDLDFVNQVYRLQSAKVAGSAYDLQGVPVYAQGSIPDNAADRYIVIGNDTLIEWDTDGRTGFEATLVIHTWDTTAANRSFIPLKEIMGDVYNLLHRAELPLISYNAIGLDFEFSETFLDPDGLTRHGVQRFRVYMRG